MYNIYARYLGGIYASLLKTSVSPKGRYGCPSVRGSILYTYYRSAPTLLSPPHRCAIVTVELYIIIIFVRARQTYNEIVDGDYYRTETETTTATRIGLCVCVWSWFWRQIYRHTLLLLLLLLWLLLFDDGWNAYYMVSLFMYFVFVLQENDLTDATWPSADELSYSCPICSNISATTTPKWRGPKTGRSTAPSAAKVSPPSPVCAPTRPRWGDVV